MKNVIVTGGAGFIGSNLVKLLVNDNYNVTVIEKQGVKYNNLDSVIDKIDIFEYDGNVGNMLEYFSGKKIDGIFHLASAIIGFHTVADVDNMIDSNIKFGVHLLELMLENNIKYFINTGTFSQHFDSSEKYIPTNFYAATKQSFIDMIKYYTDVEDIKCITLKLFDNYSEEDIRIKLMNLLADSCGSSEEVVLTPGEQEMNLTHAKDVCSAFVCAYEHIQTISSDYEEYYVYSPITLKVKEVVELYEKVNNCKINVNWGGKDYRPMEIMKLRKEYRVLPNWQPKISLEEGFKRMGNKRK